MTTLINRKADKQELAVFKQAEQDAYKLRVEGHAEDYSVEPNAQGRYPRKFFVGAIIEVVEQNTVAAVAKVQDLLDEGYKLSLNPHYLPTVSFGLNKFYLVKPEALQAKDIEALDAEVAAKYEKEIEDHNHAVFVQELEVARLEILEEQRLAQIAQQAKDQSEIERRARERVRGSKAPAKKEEV